MKKILLCLDYNETIDNLQRACSNAEMKGTIPTFFMGVRALVAKTKLPVECAIISAASVDDIEEEISIINAYAKQFCGKFFDPKGMVKYIVGNRSQELYNFHTDERKIIMEEEMTKKEGVEAVFREVQKEDDIKLVITGGDTEEDLSMMNADTEGVPNLFVAPKNNKYITEDLENGVFRDPRNTIQEGVGRCLIRVSQNIETLGLSDIIQPHLILAQDEGQGGQ